MRVSLVAIGLSILAFAATTPDAGAATLTDAVVFRTTGRSPWGPGAAQEFRLDRRLAVGFSRRYDGDPVFELGPIELDVFLGGAGTLGLDLGVHATGGSVDVTYPLGVDLGIPDSDRVAPGGRVTLSSAARVGPGATVRGEFPTLSSYLNLVFDLHAALRVDNPNDFLSPLSLTITDPGSPYVLRRLFDVTPEWGVRILENEISRFANGYVSLEGHVPRLTSTGTAVDGDAVTTSGRGPLVDVWMDVDRFASAQFGLPSFQGSLGGVAGYNLLDAQFSGGVGVAQDLEFDPVPMVTFEFDSPVRRADSGAWIDSITSPVGTPLHLVAPDSDVTVTPIYFLADPMLTNRTWIPVDLDALLRVAAAEVNLSFLGLGGSRSFGPLFTWSGGLSPAITLFDRTFEIGGFGVVRGTPFLLSPGRADPGPVPEPTTAWMAVLGVLGAARLWRRRVRRS